MFPFHVPKSQGIALIQAAMIALTPQEAQLLNGKTVYLLLTEAATANRQRSMRHAQPVEQVIRDGHARYRLMTNIAVDRLLNLVQEDVNPVLLHRTHVGEIQHKRLAIAQQAQVTNHDRQLGWRTLNIL